MKTSELIGPALDWAVAKALSDPSHKPQFPDPLEGYGSGPVYTVGTYSTDWSQGGPIIERKVIAIYKGEPGARQPDWHAYKWGQQGVEHKGYGPTPLIAAMRCFVASKLGDEVDVPEELL